MHQNCPGLQRSHDGELLIHSVPKTRCNMTSGGVITYVVRTKYDRTSANSAFQCFNVSAPLTTILKFRNLLILH